MHPRKTVVPLKVMFAKFGLSFRLAQEQYSPKYHRTTKPKPKLKPRPKLAGPKPSFGRRKKKR